MIDSPSFYTCIDSHLETTRKLEESLLGAVFKSPACITHAMDNVCGADFHDISLGRAFDHIGRLALAGEPIADETFLFTSMRKAGLLDAIGGFAAIARLVDEGLPQHVRYYSLELVKWSQLRKLRSVAGEMLSETDSRDPDVQAIATNASNAITLATASRSSDLLTAGDVCESALVSIDSAIKSGVPIGLPTGIESIDRVTGGLFPELTILAARPSVGKTAMGLELAARAADNGKRVLFCSLEMTGEQIAHRLLSRQTGISISDIRAGSVSKLQRERLATVRERMREWPWRFWAQAGVTVDAIKNKARMHSARYGLDLLIVDYLGLIRGSNQHAKPYERISQISNDLATMTKQLGKPVVCLCQLSRGAEGDKPRLDHLRDSGAIEQDADNVWFLHRERGKPETELIIAKARQGEVGTIDLEFDANRCSFGEKISRNDFGGFYSDFGGNQ